MNTCVTVDCAIPGPTVAFWNGSQTFEHLTTDARRLTFTEYLFQPEGGPGRNVESGLAESRHDVRPTEIVRQRMAVLIADVVGYSRLIEADDAGTVARLRRLRRELVDPTAARFRAALVRHTADAILLAFTDPMQAIGCALTLQSGLFALSERMPETQSLRLRVGLSLGEVLLVDGDVHGTSVNIAARLEALAEPGEIYLCERAYDRVREALPPLFEPVGERWLRNISAPVLAFRVAVESIAGIARGRILPASAQDSPACSS